MGWSILDFQSAESMILFGILLFLVLIIVPWERFWTDD